VTTEVNSELDYVMQRMQRMTSLLGDNLDAAKFETFSGTDEAETVHVTTNGRHRLTELRIDSGLLRLGVGAVARRIKEAVGNAQKAATAGAAAADEELKARLEEIVRELQLAQFGPGSVADGTPR
jgi:DNA-binding protein YbaB